MWIRGFVMRCLLYSPTSQNPTSLSKGLMRDLGVSDVAGKSDAKVFKSRHMSSPYGVVEGPKSKPVHLGMLETNKGIGPCGSCNPHLKERVVSSKPKWRFLNQRTPITFGNLDEWLNSLVVYPPLLHRNYLTHHRSLIYVNNADTRTCEIRLPLWTCCLFTHANCLESKSYHKI